MEASLQSAYRSCSNHLGREFLGSLLAASHIYRRAVGFFSSSVFSACSEEWVEFFAEGGTVQLVCCPQLSLQDIQSLAKGLYERPLARRALNLETLEAKKLESPELQREFLSWLVATDRLEIRIALREQVVGHEIYHEKIALFSDSDEQLVAVIGSANESRSAYLGNFERLDTFASFSEGSDRRRSFNVERQFRELWANETLGVEVMSLDLAFRRNSLTYSEETTTTDQASKAEQRSMPNVRVPPEALRPASGIVPREHQKEAIRSWAKAGGRGLLEMATGSGKTITAMTLATRFYDAQGGPLVVLIIAPLVHLVDQWRSICRAFGLDPVRCAEGTTAWHGELSAAVDSINAGRRPLLSVVTTSSTLATEAFQRQLLAIRVPMLLIADEAHNYGAEATFRALPEHATARVGLSATPDRAHDEEGNRRLEQYFGGSVFQYDLRDALNDKVLCPYRYHPQIVQLDPPESEAYHELSVRIRRLLPAAGKDKESKPSDALKRLLIRRARLVATAKGKLPLLKTLLQPLRSSSHILVYCGDGRVEGPEDGELVRQIDEAVRMIGRDLGMRCAKYTAETPPARRKELIAEFDSGDIQVLVAIRCLDEGVDVPSTRTAFMLASSTNPRQFVQRRGRVLRQFPGKERAHVYDFFVTMSPDEVPRESPVFSSARSLLRSQLRRVREFTDLAENGPTAQGVLLELRDHFNLLAEG